MKLVTPLTARERMLIARRRHALAQLAEWTEQLQQVERLLAAERAERAA